MTDQKPVYFCRTCGTKWVPDGKSFRPIWGQRARNCQGRMELVPSLTKGPK